jgi:uncharacterized protein (DUF1697 family)
VTRQVALLRGVNVGRNQRVAMSDLRDIATGLGWTEVSTHLQSGNVLLTSAQLPELVGRSLEAAIRDRLGMSVTVVVRTEAQLARVVGGNPFPDADDPSRYLVVFLPAAVDPARVARLDPLELPADEFSASGAELYVWCPQGVLASGVLKALGRSGLDAGGTARNWRTVTRLLQLLAK